MSTYTTESETELASFSDGTQSAIDAGIAIAEPTELAEGSRYAFVVPAGGTVREVNNDLDAYRASPRRKTGTVTVHDAASFVAYIAKHGLPETEVYADHANSALVAVINGHRSAVDGATEEEAYEGVPGWGDHRVRLGLTKTPAWVAWEQHHKKLLRQAPFAEHVEERIVDFVEPTGADMLELAQSFHATRSAKFDSSQRIKTGETQIRYHEEIDAKAGKRGDIAIPDSFTLGLTPFEGSASYRVTARLRYRINDGELVLGYVLDRPEEVLRSAFVDIVLAVGEGITQPVWRGLPPS